MKGTRQGLCFWLLALIAFWGCKPPEDQLVVNKRFIIEQINARADFPVAIKDTVRYSKGLFYPSSQIFYREGKISLSRLDSVNNIRFFLYQLNIKHVDAPSSDECIEGTFLVVKDHNQRKNNLFLVSFYDERYPFFDRYRRKELPERKPGLVLENTFFEQDVNRLIEQLEEPDIRSLITTLCDSTLQLKRIDINSMDYFLDISGFDKRTNDREVITKRIASRIKRPDFLYYETKFFKYGGLWEIQILNNKVKINLLKDKYLICWIL